MTGTKWTRRYEKRKARDGLREPTAKQLAYAADLARELGRLPKTFRSYRDAAEWIAQHQPERDRRRNAARRNPTPPKRPKVRRPKAADLRPSHSTDDAMEGTPNRQTGAEAPS